MKQITKRPDGSIRVCTINNEPDQTQQQFKTETDINVIVGRYIKQFGVEPNAPLTPQITDHTGLANMSLDEIQNEMIAKRDSFNDLTPKLKKRFKDPNSFMSFISNPENLSECISLGIYNAPQTNPTSNVVVSETSAASTPNPTTTN